MPLNEKDLFLKDPLARTVHLPTEPTRKNGRKSKSAAGQQNFASTTSHKAVVEIPLRYDNGLSLQHKSRLSVKTSFPLYTTTTTRATSGAPRQEVKCSLAGVSALRGKTGYTTGSAGIQFSHHHDPENKGRCTTLSAGIGTKQPTSAASAASAPFNPSAAAPVLNIGIATSKPRTKSLISANVSFPSFTTGETSQFLMSLSASKQTKLLNNNKRGLRPLQLQTQCSAVADPVSSMRSTNFGVSLSPAVSSTKSIVQPSWVLRFGWNTKERSKKACPLVGFSVSMWLPKIKALCTKKLLDLSILWKGDESWQIMGMWTQTVSKDDNVKSSPNRRIGVGVNLNGKTAKPGLLSWIFTWTEGDVTLRVPILLTQSTTIAPTIYYEQAFQFFFLSFASGLIQHVVGHAFLAASTADHEQRQALNNGNLRRKYALQEALQQQSLMKRQATIRMEAERQRNGLVITRATYYLRRDSGQEVQDGENSLDVTVPLQFWVNDSKLELFESSKRSSMLGFYDITEMALSTKAASTASHSSDSIGNDSSWSSTWKRRFFAFWFESEENHSRTSVQSQVSELKVWYDYAGLSYVATVGDEEEITLPSARAKLIL